MMHIIYVENQEKGIDAVISKLTTAVDHNTLLFLSGGKTPFPLYQRLSHDRNFQVGAVALVDERFGPAFHPESNESMIKETGLMNYFENKNIPFCRILGTNTKSFEETAKDYDRCVNALLSRFKRSVGIFGVGNDGHTAGILPNRSDFNNPVFGIGSQWLVMGICDKNPPKGGFEKRITLTPSGIRRIRKKIVMAFGSEKRIVLKRLIGRRIGSIEKFPASILLQPSGLNTVLVTDQQV